MPFDRIQAGVFLLLTVLMAALTWWQCRRMQRATPIRQRNEARGQFLAGGTLTWPFIAGGHCRQAPGIMVPAAGIEPATP